MDQISELLFSLDAPLLHILQLANEIDLAFDIAVYRSRTCFFPLIKTPR